jgi:hypothetical protein
MPENTDQKSAPTVMHRYFRWVVAIAVGIFLALLAFERATDPEPTRQKALEEEVVREARILLESYVLPGGELQLVDPLSPDRKVGKTYIWPDDNGWEVSGYYRRNAQDPWHPFLMNLDAAAELTSLAVKDRNERIIGLSVQDPKLSAVP